MVVLVEELVVQEAVAVEQEVCCQELLLYALVHIQSKSVAVDRIVQGQVFVELHHIYS